jgi:hypothetical protein
MNFAKGLGWLKEWCTVVGKGPETHKSSSFVDMKAYLHYASTRDFYLASVATDLALDPYGAVVMPVSRSGRWGWHS